MIETFERVRGQDATELYAMTIRVMAMACRCRRHMHKSCAALCTHKIRFPAKRARRFEPLQGPTFETSVPRKKVPRRSDLIT